MAARRGGGEVEGKCMAASCKRRSASRPDLGEISAISPSPRLLPAVRRQVEPREGIEPTQSATVRRRARTDRAGPGPARTSVEPEVLRHAGNIGPIKCSSAQEKYAQSESIL